MKSAAKVEDKRVVNVYILLQRAELTKVKLETYQFHVMDRKIPKFMRPG